MNYGAYCVVYDVVIEGNIIFFRQSLGAITIDNGQFRPLMAISERSWYSPLNYTSNDPRIRKPRQKPCHQPMSLKEGVVGSPKNQIFGQIV